MSELSSIDLKALSEDPEFRNLTVEEAMRRLGEKEKALIESERVRVVTDLRSRLEENVASMKSIR
jgi:hypothetical protein